MSTPLPVLIPLINPNEPEARLAALHVQAGQFVKRGEALATLETTKATADLEAEADGYFVGLRFSAGQSVTAGQTLAYLAASPNLQDWELPGEPAPASRAGEDAPPTGLRISQPALALARQHQLDLSQFPADAFVTESAVRQAIEKAAGTAFSPPAAAFDPTAILVYGGGGHGKSLIDLLRVLGTYRIVGVVDDGLHAEAVLGVPLLGGGEALAGLHAQGVRLAVNAVGGIGNVAVRIKVFQRLTEAGFTCPAVVHPSAYVEPSASLSPGVQVFPHAYVGSAVRLGYGAIVNTGAIVSHDCVLGNYTNISPGAMLAGEVRVGDGSLVGMGATVNLQVNIGAGARIGNGATVKADVPAGGIVRAGSIWPDV